MKIKEKITDAKLHLDRAKRRVSAIASHGQAVVESGIGAIRTTGEVASMSVSSVWADQKKALRDDSKGFLNRAKQVGSVTRQGAATTFEEVSRSMKAGFSQIVEKVARVPNVTRKEQAEENKISRKLKKAQKTVRRHAAVTPSS